MIVVDVEIEKAIPPYRGQVRHPDIQYCEGWRDFKGMGITVVCTYDLVTGLTGAWLKEDLQELQGYLTNRATAGFNTRRFDKPLLEEHGLQLNDELHYDMLEQIWVAQGLDPDRFQPATHGGWGLDAVCGETLRINKTGDGAMAPIWWQRGQRGRVINYCLNDVWMEMSLLRHIVLHREVRRPNRRLDIEVPEWVCRSLQS
ncbi:MAG TPA: hypothetical protein VGG49_13185 [Steroidobacteraceae bacterium]|jgi:hypothetical protein